MTYPLPPTGDVIEVDELRLRCVIGVNPEECRSRQDVMINLHIGTDARAAAVTDCVNAVWNYRTATKAIISHVESSSYLDRVLKASPPRSPQLPSPVGTNHRIPRDSLADPGSCLTGTG